MLWTARPKGCGRMQRYEPFSRKQLQLLTWWRESSPYCGYDGIIADGAVRSGKTLAMSLSFVLWAMAAFDGGDFAMCGKTMGSLRRNVWNDLKPRLLSRGFLVREVWSEHRLEIRGAHSANRFYVFGGGDAGSADLIQGMTLCGVLFDEAALMNEGFVNQAAARCSVPGSKFWFNCNPEGPRHWFKTQWVDKRQEKRLCYLHFTMSDNLSLTPEVRERYERMYTGVFYERYVLGRWAAAEGLVYDMFGPGCMADGGARNYEQYYVSCDYGTQNPTVFLLWGLLDGVWYAVQEYYYDGRARGLQKTDAQYADDLEAFTAGIPYRAVILDPSAASFIAELKRRGVKVRRACNAVLDGIRLTGSLLSQGKVKICRGLDNTIQEFGSYRWEEAALARGEDRPVKEHDHAMDAVRYFCATTLGEKRRENKSR